MMAVAQQEMAVGTPVANRLAALGVKGKRMIPPPTKLCGLIVGLSETGKSSFIQSCPDGFIINADLSSTTNPDPKAIIWPDLDDNGNPCDPVEGRIEMSWDRVLAKKTLLIQMAANNEPRPAVVFLDTLNMSIGLVRAHVAKFAYSRYKIADSDDRHWNSLHGPAAWDAVYAELIELAMNLRNAGYGFYYTMHLINRTINLGDNLGAKEKLDVNVTENFWSRLFGMFEIVLALDYDTILNDRVIERDIGGGRKRRETITDKIPTRTLIIQDPDRLRGVVKTRRRRLPPRIRLDDEANEWSVFQTAYMNAVAAELSPSAAANPNAGDSTKGASSP